MFMKWFLMQNYNSNKFGELIEYSDQIAESYTQENDVKIRKAKGQFFTPKEVSNFMASLFNIKGNSIYILDPGAGVGILTASICERLLQIDKKLNVYIDLYENDPALIPLLNKVMKITKQKLQYRGHNVNINIINNDFILHNTTNISNQSELFYSDKNQSLYNYVIANPPYFKLNKNSPQSRLLNSLVSGQPNIYFLFMALSASMLKMSGEMVFITPRSFCSGLYYKKFRKWFLYNTQIKNIHIFESRKDVFDKDEILQENIILRAIKRKKPIFDSKITISTSKNKKFNEFNKFVVNTQDIIYQKNGDIFIRIPSSLIDVEVLHIIDSWPKTLNEIGLNISTGPVVPFRAEKYLMHEKKENSELYPLLWMHNMKNLGIEWPYVRNNKALTIRLTKKTRPLLIPVRNYVLLNRFSSKEQKRRLKTSVLLESEFHYKKVGIENHVNYIYKVNGTLSTHEAFGIATLLSSNIMDNYFRSLNGNTQVNATDIKSLPLPDIRDIRRIGELVYKVRSKSQEIDSDEVVAKTLGIDMKLINRINKTEHDHLY